MWVLKLERRPTRSRPPLAIHDQRVTPLTSLTNVKEDWHCFFDSLRGALRAQIRIATRLALDRSTPAPCLTFVLLILVPHTALFPSNPNSTSSRLLDNRLASSTSIPLYFSSILDEAPFLLPLRPSGSPSAPRRRRGDSSRSRRGWRGRDAGARGRVAVSPSLCGRLSWSSASRSELTCE